MFPDAPLPKPQFINSSKSYFSAFLITTILAVILAGITLWALVKKTSVENELANDIAIAVSSAEMQITKKLQAEFENQSKSPYKEAFFAESLGGISLEYPKSWSLYIVERNSGNTPEDLYGHPGEVPYIESQTAFGLRLAVINNSYDKEISKFQKLIESGQLSVSTINSNDTLGIKLQGKITDNVDGIVVVLPYRDKTIKIWTESRTFVSDFNKILDSLSFQP